MLDSHVYFQGLALTGLLGLLAWLVSVARHNVTLVDSLWSLFFLLSTLTYYFSVAVPSVRAEVLLVLVLIWSLRLSGYLSWRNWNKPEDHRYQQIRRNNSPHFWLKSLYIIFGFQVVLAWMISLPLHAAALSSAAFGLLDVAGVLLWVFGFSWETIADWQLAKFKSKTDSTGKVMDKGLWRYSRHPNYFGECCVWWGYYLLACSAGAWWAFPAPVLMTFMLLKVSGVALLEKDIAERRPAYIEYMAKTPAFFPFSFSAKTGKS